MVSLKELSYYVPVSGSINNQKDFFVAVVVGCRQIIAVLL